ncbi:hypothetical protein FRB96_001345 [Tulasnella sp. 330]|nr:hypothetical protein FRB96_001345 [Tulasnella sp. 330]
MKGTFQNEWQFAGLYNRHILFSQVVQEFRSGALGKKLLIYDVNTHNTQTVSVKYDTAGLGPHGHFLLYRRGDEMYMYEVAKARVSKSEQLRNLSKWTYNAMGFCMVDSFGKFWRWNFHDKLPPALVFRLVDRAPTERLRCLTTRDGAWNAIVATDMDCTRGEIHCYPSNNDEARIFKGVLAAFGQAESTDRKSSVTLVAIVNVSHDELSFFVHQLGPPAHRTFKSIETKISLPYAGGNPSAMFIHHNLGVVVVLVVPMVYGSSSSSISSSTYDLVAQSFPAFIALVFNLLTGDLLLREDVPKGEDESWFVDDTGLFRELSDASVQKLNVVDDSPPLGTGIVDGTARQMMG